MFKLGRTSLDGREALCRTDEGVVCRKIIRWMVSEPGSPWLTARLAVVETSRRETITWDFDGWPVIRRKRMRWQWQGPRGPVLAELAYAVLEKLSDYGTVPQRCRALVTGVDHWASLTGTPPVKIEEIQNAIRFLRKIGYVERAPHDSRRAVFRLTPSGYAATVLHRRARRSQRPYFALPTPEQVGRSFVQLDPDYLDLPSQARNSLEKAGIRTAGALAGMTRQELLQLRNIGKEAVGEIAIELKMLGLPLARAAPEVPVSPGA